MLPAVEYLLGDGGRNITGAASTIDVGNTACPQVQITPL
jgi:hypothetical protein